MTNQLNENQVNFKAWIEKSGTGTLKLHVHGEVDVQDSSLQYELDKKVDQGYFPDELFLVIKPEPVPGTSKVSIKYHEELEHEHMYKKITITGQSEQVYEITDIQTKQQ